MAPIIIKKNQLVPGSFYPDDPRFVAAYKHNCESNGYKLEDVINMLGESEKH